MNFIIKKGDLRTMELEKLRTIHNLTQVEVAKKLGLAKMTYHNYETGRNEPNIQNLIKIADFYNISIDYLVGRNFNNEFGYMSEDEKILVSDFRKLNSYNQAKIIGEVVGMLMTQN